MIKNFKYAFCILGISVCAWSCIDSTYDIDKLNKDAIYPIPPVPMGNIDTIWVNTLDKVQDPANPAWEKDKIVKLQKLKNFFQGDIIDKFFYEGAKKNVTLETKVDVEILDNSSSLDIEVHMRVINTNDVVVSGMRIPSQKLSYGKNQEMNIIFPVEYFPYMQGARDLDLIFVMRGDSMHLTDKNYIYIKNLVLKSGGVHFKF